jgi:hypothetical protein
MDLERTIAELREEFERIQHAVAVLEKLAAGGAKRRGRPPKWLANAQRTSVPAGGADTNGAIQAKKRSSKGAAAVVEPPNEDAEIS